MSIINVVNAENIHELTYKFIEENNIIVINYEESMTKVYLDMVLANYRFIIDRDLLHEIYCEIAYRLGPNDVLNRDRLLMTLPLVISDSDEEVDANDIGSNSV